MKGRNGKKFNKKEIDLIMDNYHILGPEELSKILKRTKKSITNKACKINAERLYKSWTPVEIDYLSNYYKNTSPKDFNLLDLSDYLGRHKSTVCKKAKDMGYTDISRNKSNKSLEKLSKRMKKWHSENAHPKGMLGKHHTKEMCDRMSKTRTGLKMNLSDEQRKVRSERGRENAIKLMSSGNAYSRTKSGVREDIGFYVRSNWEANYVRILNLENIGYAYEKTIFDLKTEKYGIKKYIMDFTLNDGFVEVKGWLNDSSKKTLKMFKECCPKEFNETTLVINKKDDKTHKWLHRLGIKKFIFYNELRVKYKDKINWEGY